MKLSVNAAGQNSSNVLGCQPIKPYSESTPYKVNFEGGKQQFENSHGDTVCLSSKAAQPLEPKSAPTFKQKIAEAAKRFMGK
jgi:hypothetical protein